MDNLHNFILNTNTIRGRSQMIFVTFNVINFDTKGSGVGRRGINFGTCDKRMLLPKIYVTLRGGRGV